MGTGWSRGVASAQRTGGLTLLKNHRDQGRLRVEFTRWRKGFSDIAKSRSVAGNLFWETVQSH